MIGANFSGANIVCIWKCVWEREFTWWQLSRPWFACVRDLRGALPCCCFTLRWCCVVAIMRQRDYREDARQRERWTSRGDWMCQMMFDNLLRRTMHTAMQKLPALLIRGAQSKNLVASFAAWPCGKTVPSPKASWLSAAPIAQVLLKSIHTSCRHLTMPISQASVFVANPHCLVMPPTPHW